MRQRGALFAAGSHLPPLPNLNATRLWATFYSTASQTQTLTPNKRCHPERSEGQPSCPSWSLPLPFSASSAIKSFTAKLAENREPGFLCALRVFSSWPLRLKAFLTTKTRPRAGFKRSQLTRAYCLSGVLSGAGLSALSGALSGVLSEAAGAAFSGAAFSGAAADALFC